VPVNQYDDIRKIWKEIVICTADDLDTALHNFRILFAYHSGKIENDLIDFHDTREIFENGKVIAFTGDPRTLFEQQNQKLCYDFLKGKIAAKKPLTVRGVLEIHGILTAGLYDERRYVTQGERPGRFKQHDYITGVYEVGYPPAEVEPAIEELLDEINDEKVKDVLLAAAYFHARFEHIHPFADGNGRVGRTLMNYYLMTKGEPPLIVFEEDRKMYYQALEKYDADEDIRPLRDFLQAEAIKTWDKTRKCKLGLLEERKRMSDLVEGQS